MSTSSYYTKTIRHYGNELAILMQNENGPCPLLAIANVLILRGGIYIHPDIAEISFEDLTARMAEYMLDQSATLSETDEVLTFEDFRAAYRSGNKCCFMASSSLCRH